VDVRARCAFDESGAVDAWLHRSSWSMRIVIAERIAVKRAAITMHQDEPFWRVLRAQRQTTIG
jgi:hypothetical protein